ncbi:DNA-formamidopyrimidine glycosylase family protein [Mucilaginibacter antarcticus]|uniref:DNA-formamidopyrimidine glycosylase family protein n=1 Tax=Mucilaginibacter antarcticus TaxID=1855725 RepID=UPI00362A7F0A
MPELPDLQVFSKNLNKLFKGKTLNNIEITNAKNLNVSAAKLREALEGSELAEVKRVGKELHFEFNNKHILAIHLMLNGKLHTLDGSNENKFSIIALFLRAVRGWHLPTSRLWLHRPWILQRAIFPMP